MTLSEIFKRTTIDEKRVPGSCSNNFITLDEVCVHDDIGDCWIVIYDRVYDVTDFLQMHPGGYEILMEYAGRDASLAFRGTGHSKYAIQSLKKYEIGLLPKNERMYDCIRTSFEL